MTAEATEELLSDDQLRAIARRNNESSEVRNQRQTSDTLNSRATLRTLNSRATLRTLNSRATLRTLNSRATLRTLNSRATESNEQREQRINCNAFGNQNRIGFDELLMLGVIDFS
ncbi:hypothetical protein AVEN_157867-1 [Araneus ventricosus]|uniref:Uncharacterized protein n=1 Tax=Araneus ventricosus TaxID=182803 RepID=A0A4Y2E635_ARAVE|nr:hypothetical protein AVEN_157867-1 [Araneus ventricosus]